jgi:N-acetyl-1-D-myo-inositol-2-amino-2-deoxy-alpha-D-glucopyranoside deacetylase
MPGLLSFHAHPDDESIAMGGTLARFASQGEEVLVVTATDGALGEVHNYHDPEQVKARLAQVRAEELHHALSILGVGGHEFLGYRDSGMMGWDDNLHPDCFWQAGFVEATGRLITLIRKHRPAIMTIYDPFGGYGHPDHIQVHRVGLAAYYLAADQFRFPLIGDEESWQPDHLWMSVWPASRMATWADLGEASGRLDTEQARRMRASGCPDERVSVWMDVEDLVDKKLAAIGAHRSQIPPDWSLINVPEEHKPELLGREAFVELLR